MEETKIERPAFLMDLLAEVDRCEGELFPPDGAVEKGERVIGEVTGYARRFYCLSQFYRREVKLMDVELEFDKENKGRQSLRSEMAHKHEVLLALWWFCVNVQFDAWAINIGIRANWQLVETVHSKRGEMPAFLRRLFEAGQEGE